MERYSAKRGRPKKRKPCVICGGSTDSHGCCPTSNLCSTCSNKFHKSHLEPKEIATFKRAPCVICGGSTVGHECCPTSNLCSNCATNFQRSHVRPEDVAELKKARSEELAKAEPSDFKVGDKVTQTELSGKTIGTVLSVHDKSLVVEFVKGRPVDLPSKELRKSTPEELAKAELSDFKVGDKVDRTKEIEVGDVIEYKKDGDTLCALPFRIEAAGFDMMQGMKSMDEAERNWAVLKSRGAYSFGGGHYMRVPGDYGEPDLFVETIGTISHRDFNIYYPEWKVVKKLGVWVPSMGRVQFEPPALPSNRCRMCHSILVTRQSVESGLCEGCRAKYRRQKLSAPFLDLTDFAMAGVAGLAMMGLPLLMYKLYNKKS